MKTSVLWQLAKRSISGHKKTYVPFIFANILLFASEYILLSLSANEYIQERHEALPLLLNIGLVLGSLVIMIIAFYTSFFIQNQLTKEFGLYTILGLEKKHVRRVSFYQLLIPYLIVIISAPITGYLTGQFLFVMLNRIMKDTGASFMDYPIDWMSVGVVILLITALYLTIYFVSVWKIYRLNPLDLFKDSRSGSGTPKNRWITLIAGLVLTGYGYYLALTVTDILQAFSTLFIAILCVILGTYLLMNSLLTILLKVMQGNKKFYYKPVSFLTVSGMLHRIGNNTVALASTAILATGVILVSGLVLSTYRTMENQATNVQPLDYQAFMKAEFDMSNDEKATQLNHILSEIDEQFEVTESHIEKSQFINANFVNNGLLPLYAPDDPRNEALPNDSKRIFLLLSTKENYYDSINETPTEGDEWIISTNTLDIENVDALTVNDQKTDTKIVENTMISSVYGIEVLYIALNSEEEIQQLSSTLEYEYPEELQHTLHFDIRDNTPEKEAVIQKIVDENEAVVESKRAATAIIYQLNGGLLFIGILISLILLIGTGLLLYYRQVSQGVEDQKNYQIMKQVGLPNSLIKKTIRRQVLWIFFLPLLIGIIHNIVASKLLFTLMGMIGLSKFSVYASSFLIVTVAFSLLYLIFFWLTSRVYYQIVNESTH